MHDQLCETCLPIAAAFLRQSQPLCSQKLMMAAGPAGLTDSWAKEVPRLLGALQGAGLWRSTVLAHFFSTSPPSLSEVQDFLVELMPDVGEDEQDLYAPYVQQAVAAARLDRRRIDYERATVPVWEVAAEDMRRKRERDAAEYDKLFQRQKMAKAQRIPPPSPAGIRVGSISREARELDGDPQAREKGERLQREKWVRTMTDYMTADGIEDARPRLAAAGRRAATLRTRILAWRPFRAWLEKSFGTTRARGIDDYVEFLLLRADEPCSRSTLDGVVAMYTFIEGLHGRPRGARWVDDPRFQASVKEIRLGLSRRLDGNEVRKAIRPTWRLLGGLEQVIMNEGASDFDRAISWFICASSWCSLRFDDHRGWLPGSPAVDPGGFTWDLVRTKTTGRGKSVELRPVGLSIGAYVKEENWFEVGRAVHDRMSPGDRDYLLTIPPKGWGDSAVPRELTYEEYVPRMRAALAKVPLGEDYVGKTLAEAFTAHSWRFFIPSAASALGYTQDQVDSMGAWSVKGGSGYNKTAKERARRVQEHIARVGRSESARRDVFGETLDQAEVTRRTREKGLDEQEARICARRLITEHVTPEEDPAEEEYAPKPDLSLSADAPTAPSSSSASASTSTAARLPAEVSGYVISVVGRGKHRCLHYLGLCHRVPGIDYLNYVIHGDDVPGADEYDKVCRKCWPQGAPGEEAPGAETEAEGGVTDNSDTSAE